MVALMAIPGRDYSSIEKKMCISVFYRKRAILRGNKFDLKE